MDKKVIEAIYYIPDPSQPGGAFYREFSGLGTFLPDTIEPLLKELPDDITFETLPIYLEMKYNIKLKATGANILDKETEIRPYIAYRSSQIKFVNKQEVIKSNLDTIKRYYKFTCNEETSKYEKEKKRVLNL